VKKTSVDRVPISLRYAAVANVVASSPYVKIYDERTWATYAIEKGEAL
jgi:hypothetical protein